MTASLPALPFLLFINFMRLLWYKQLRQIKTVICLHWPEKIILTPLAKLLNLSIIWMEMPGFDYEELKPWMRSKYLKQSANAKLVCWTSWTKQKLIELGVKEDNCIILLPGINPKDYLYQENIFDNLAFANPAGQKRFTIGTVVDLNEHQRIEMLLQALEICLGLDSDIQLVVIGSGKQRKKIDWLVKKMKLNNHVWLVSDQVSLKKWFNNFDLFVVASKNPDLDNIVVTIGAMANGLAVIAPHDSCLGDLSFNNQAAVLTEISNGEILARKIIRLQQDYKLRKQLGVNAKAVVNKYFMFERAARELMDILK